MLYAYMGRLGSPGKHVPQIISDPFDAYRTRCYSESSENHSQKSYSERSKGEMISIEPTKK